jgi:O-antigen/teichoic acid export membrane protein
MPGLVFRQFIVSSAGAILTKAIGVITTIIVARLLGPTDFGLFALTFSVISFVSGMLDLGIIPAITKFAAETENDRDIVYTGFLVDVIRIIAGFSICLAIAYPMENFLGKQIGNLIIIAALFLIPSCFGAFSARLWARRRIYSYTVVDLSYNLFVLFFAVLFLIVLQMGIQGVIFSYIIAQSLRACLLTILAGVKGTFRLPILKKIMRFSIFLTIGNMSFVFWTNISLILLGFYVSSYDLGGFYVAKSFSQLLYLIPSAYSTVIFPLLSKAHGENDVSKIKEIFEISSGSIILYGIIGIIGYIFLGEPILRILFGRQYLYIVTVLKILVISVGLNCWTMILNPTFIAMNKPNVIAKIAMVNVAMGPLLYMLFIGNFGWGIYGAAVTEIIVTAIYVTLAYYEVRKLTKAGIRFSIRWLYQYFRSLFKHEIEKL